jgi:hypothetical protein
VVGEPRIPAGNRDGQMLDDGSGGSGSWIRAISTKKTVLSLESTVL